MTWGAVQVWTAGTGSGSTASASGTATTLGNTLVAGLSFQNTLTATTPAGWTLGETGSPSGGGAGYLFFYPNASSITGLSVTLSGSTNWVLLLGELSGGGATVSLDGANSYLLGSSTGSITTTSASDAVIGLLFGDDGVDTWSGQTGGFSIWSQGKTGSRSFGASGVLLYQINASAGSYSSSASPSDNSGDYGGLIIGLQIGSPPPPSNAAALMIMG